MPVANLIGGEGDGFAIAQARLGPGRIHHCMRSIGVAERAIELMCDRAEARVAFGKPLAEQGVVRDWIAESRVRLEQLRLLVLKTAWLMDTVGNKGAHTEIQAIKIATPATVQWILDKAIQVHGAGGLSQDFPLASMVRRHPHPAVRRRPRRGAQERPGQGRAACARRPRGRRGMSDVAQRAGAAAVRAGRGLPRRARPRDHRAGWSSCGPGSTPGWPGCPSPRAWAGWACRRRCRPTSTPRSPRPERPTNDPERNGIGLGMAAPTILAFGTEEQKQRFLRPLWTGEEIWCQLFSEPGAGSDLANVSTRAVATATSGSSTVRRCGPPARTTPGSRSWSPAPTRTRSKHAGLTYFLCDMTDPGVDVRPLRQITGEAEFNEVFLTDVRIPDSHRLGGVGEGWKVANATLNNERVSIGKGAGREGGMIGVVADTWRRAPRAAYPGAARPPAAPVGGRRGRPGSPVSACAQKLASGPARPRGLGDEAAFARVAQQLSGLEVELLGEDGLRYEDGQAGPWSAPSGSTSPAATPATATCAPRATRSRAAPSEILRNIVAERVLGLPAEHRIDKDRPWKELAK